LSMPYQTGSQNSEVLGQNQAISEKSFYDLAEVLVCDPVASNRTATRSALYSLGCRHVEITGSLRDFLEALENRPPDLALCEAQAGEAELCHAIRELRHGEQSYNPFAIIIVTAWKPSATLATEFLHSGADGLLLRPFSTALLDQQIRTHVLQQKPFIVTDDYIGPERRAMGHPSSAPMLAPLNSLKMKIEGRADPDEAIRRFNAELHSACAKLASVKQQRSSSPLRD
ncbi:MAG: response regulator, partial [Candidatus Micrarchaeaceae archaeon]